MTQQGKTLVAKPDNRSSIPGTNMVEEDTNSQNYSSSDLHNYTMGQAYAHMDTTHTQNKF